MNRWSPLRYRREAADRDDVDPEVLRHALDIGSRIVERHPDVQPVFTLRHLAELSGVPYQALRSYAARRGDHYESFRIRKRPGPDGERRHRIICVPNSGLMTVQRWIAQNVLAHVAPHEASVAFAKKCKLIDAVLPHRECQWLIKLDIKSFFESISEAAVYRVFRRLGFEPLISFEMARICTRVYPGPIYDVRKWHTGHDFYSINAYVNSWQGHLPQGAPTSPMLANLTSRALDKRLSAMALDAGLEYTRYADDMTFSTRSLAFDRQRAATFVGEVYVQLVRHGFSPNRSKSTVVAPGGRKIVLGLLIDGTKPRLSREFKSALRQHIYYLTHPQVGPVKHAAARGFASIVGMRNHLLGLIGYAGQVEAAYAAARRAEFESVNWPI